MIELENKSDIEIDVKILENILNSFSKNSVELIITNNEEISQLNNEHRGKDSHTDVLSFPLETPFTNESIMGFPLGSIVMSEEYIKNKSQELNHSLNDEVALLFIHGLLHLLGFDHEEDDGEMRDKEEELISKFNLPKSLIVRTEEI